MTLNLEKKVVLKSVILNSWITMLLASSLAVIIWREFFTMEPIWWPWIHAIGLLIIFSCTIFVKSLKSLRSFVVIILIIFCLGYGGGWQWGLIPFIRSSSMWIEWEAQVPWELS